jgi:hypothetical protein
MGADMLGTPTLSQKKCPWLTARRGWWISINLLDPDADRTKLVATIQAATAKMRIPVRLVVIDTLSRALAGGNENAPNDMGALVKSCDYIRQAVNAHIALIHHSGKDLALGARGHSLLRAATDTEIEISRPDTSSPSVARVTKQRELEIEGSFAFTLKTVNLGNNRRGKPVTSCVVEPADNTCAVKPRVRRAANVALGVLHKVLSTEGKPVDGINAPAGVNAVHLDVWRYAFYAQSHLETQDARKKAFQRAITRLGDARAVEVMNEHVWLVSS